MQKEYIVINMDHVDGDDYCFPSQEVTGTHRREEIPGILKQQAEWFEARKRAGVLPED